MRGEGVLVEYWVLTEMAGPGNQTRLLRQDKIKRQIILNK